jgi:hypothetical protein
VSGEERPRNQFISPFLERQQHGPVFEIPAAEFPTPAAAIGLASWQAHPRWRYPIESTK